MVVTPWSDLAPLKEVVFDAKSIWQEKDRGKEKSKPKVKETEGVFFSVQKREVKKRELSLVLGQC